MVQIDPEFLRVGDAPSLEVSGSFEIGVEFLVDVEAVFVYRCFAWGLGRPYFFWDLVWVVHSALLYSIV